MFTHLQGRRLLLFFSTHVLVSLGRHNKMTGKLKKQQRFISYSCWGEEVQDRSDFFVSFLKGIWGIAVLLHVLKHRLFRGGGWVSSIQGVQGFLKWSP